MRSGLPAAARLWLSLWMLWAAGVLAYYFAYVPRALFSRDLTLSFDLRGAVAAALIAALTAIVVFRLRRVGPRVGLRTLTILLVAAGLATAPWSMLSGRLSAALTPLAVPHIPFLGEAIARLIIGTIGALLVCLGALGAGTVILQALRLRTASVVEHLVLSTASGFLVLSFGSLLLAVLGLYRPPAVMLVIAVACFAGAAAKVDLVTGESSPRRESEDVGTKAAWLALTAAALAFGVVAALAPEKEWDALWYHLNVPRLWLEAGRPVDLVEEYVSLYPMTWELVFGAGLVLGGAIGAKLLHFVCLPLLACTVWLGARRYVGSASAAAAVAFVVTTPTMLWESGTAYNDVALALHTAIACYALARYADQGQLAWGALAALHFGGAAATKHLGVVVTIVALAIYVLVIVRSGDRSGPAIRRALLIGVAAALVPLPWYVRSYIASGNPVFPELFSVFGAAPPERWDAVTERGLDGFKARFGYGRSLADLIRLPWDVTVHGARFGGSLGPLFLVLIPVVFFFRRCRAVLAVAAGVIVYAGFWASPLSSYQMRFLMPAVAPMALLAAAGLDAVSHAAGEWHRQGRRLVIAAVFAIAFLNLPPFTRLHERDREGWTSFFTHVLRQSPIAVVSGRESEVSYLRREIPSFAAWQAINAESPENSRVLTFAGGDQFYARRRRIPHDATMARPAVSVTRDHVGEAIAGLRALGITHVLFDRDELARLDAYQLAIASPAFQQACAVVYEDRRMWVCRLDYSGSPSDSNHRADGRSLVPSRFDMTSSLRRNCCTNPEGWHQASVATSSSVRRQPRPVRMRSRTCITMRSP